MTRLTLRLPREIFLSVSTVRLLLMLERRRLWLLMRMRSARSLVVMRMLRILVRMSVGMGMLRGWCCHSHAVSFDSSRDSCSVLRARERVSRNRSWTTVLSVALITPSDSFVASGGEESDEGRFPFLGRVGRGLVRSGWGMSGILEEGNGGGTELGGREMLWVEEGGVAGRVEKGIDYFGCETRKLMTNYAKRRGRRFTWGTGMIAVIVDIGGAFGSEVVAEGVGVGLVDVFSRRGSSEMKRFPPFPLLLLFLVVGVVVVWRTTASSLLASLARALLRCVERGEMKMR